MKIDSHQHFWKFDPGRDTWIGEDMKVLRADFMLDKKFCAGISKLKKFNFTYDILIFPKHLSFAYEFVKKFPDHKFVIDHIAKPDFKKSDFSFWEKEVKKLAELPNVYCKISGLVTEAHWSQWKNADFFPAMDIVTEAFGMDRLMFGSDWPVCLLAGSYTDIWSITEQYFSAFTAHEKDNFYGDNATRFYSLE